MSQEENSLRKTRIFYCLYLFKLFSFCLFSLNHEILLGSHSQNSSGTVDKPMNYTSQFLDIMIFTA